MDDGFFRNNKPAAVIQAPTRPAMNAEVKVLPIVYGEPVLPMPGECQVVVSYMPDRPDLPSVKFAGGECHPGTELAFAVALAGILKSSYFTPIPR